MSVKHEIEDLLVRDSPEALCCVLDTLSPALYWFNPGMLEYLT